MKQCPIYLAITACLLLIWGCADDTPTTPESDLPEFTATVQIESCEGFPPDDPINDLCGRSSDVRARFGFVFADIKEEYPSSMTKNVTFRTGPGVWEFAKHGCTQKRCQLGDALHRIFENRPLVIVARRSTSAGGGGTTLGMHILAGDLEAGYHLSFSMGTVVMPVDADGFPVISNDLQLGGNFSIELQDGSSARGSATVTIKDWNNLPIHNKPEPPTVARPVYTVQELRAAPETREFANYRLAYRTAEVVRRTQGVTVNFSIWEQGLWDFDAARLDFLWVVHESGEIWEPDIQSMWDTFRMSGSAKDGPMWAAGTNVDIITGFVDLDGNVKLMRKGETIDASTSAPISP